MKRKLSALLFAGSSVVLLGGCMTGPDYVPPQMQVPDAWHQAVEKDLDTKKPSALQSWWTLFGDDMLNDLIAEAATNNPNLKVAVARIEQAAAMRGVSASQFWPDISGNAGVTAFQIPESITHQSDSDGTKYQVGLSMAWELDLWGRVRRSVESADASLQASVENYRDILVLLYADIAKNYINVRTLQERIKYAQSNLKAQASTVKLTQERFKSGLVPELDVSQAKLNFSRTASTIPPLRQQLAVAINRLGVLTGQMPYALQKELETPRSIPTAPADRVLCGVPADLLRQRPDIRRAERELAAQNARIGATQAELYPALYLPGSLTLGAADHNPFNSDGFGYGFGPQLRLNIFNGRRIRSQVDAERAATRAALHAYEQTVLSALEEVEDSMAAYAHERDRIQSLEKAAASAKKSVELVMELYKAGLTDFQNVLNMEQALSTQQDVLSASRGLVSLDLVAIYKSLGGGWQPEQMQK